MKKLNRLCLHGILATSMWLAISCSSSEKKNSPDSGKTYADTTAHQAITEVYACPMHPEQTSNVAGKCAVCGMDLEKK